MDAKRFLFWYFVAVFILAVILGVVSVNQGYIVYGGVQDAAISVSVQEGSSGGSKGGSGDSRDSEDSVDIVEDDSDEVQEVSITLTKEETKEVLGAEEEVTKIKSTDVMVRSSSDYISSGESSVSAVADRCGELIACKVIESCSSFSETRDSLSSKVLVRGNFEKSLCDYERCSGKVVYNACEVTETSTKEIVLDIPRLIEHERIKKERRLAGLSTRESSPDNRRDLSIVQANENNELEPVVSLQFSAEENRLDVSIGKSLSENACYNGKKDLFEEGVDCGFFCSKKCGADSFDIGQLGVYLWVTFIALVVVFAARVKGNA